jgi:hypothetical protein
VPPVLDFLISKGMEEYTTAANLEVYLGVARPVTLFLARESPQHTIDQLVYEITQRVYEDHPTPLPSQSSLPAAPLHLPEVRPSTPSMPVPLGLVFQPLSYCCVCRRLQTDTGRLM